MAISVGELFAYLRLDSAQFDKGLAGARLEMTGAAESASRLGGAVGMTELAFKNVGFATQGAAASTAKFRAAQLGVTAATERYNEVLANSNASVRQLALAEKGLITANERLRVTTPTASIAEMGTVAEVATAKMTGLRASMAGTLGMAKSLGLLFGAVEIVKKGIEVTKEAADFQKNMLLIQTQAGASAGQVKAFSDEILKMSGPLATAPNELAKSLYHVVSASQGILGAADMLKIMQVAAEGAKVGNADLEETTNALTAAVTSGIKGVQDYSQAMGALNVIVGAGDMKLSDLNEALSGGILAQMKTFGLSLVDVGAALDVFGDNNIRGANAATMLRTAVQAIADPVAKGTATLKSLGVSTEELGDAMNKGGLNAGVSMLVAHLEAAGKTKSITDLSKQIAGMKGQIDLGAVSASSLGQLLTEAFGKKAGPGLAILVDQFDRLQEKIKQNQTGANNFGLAWKATQGTVSFAFSTLAAEASAAGISLAQGLEPSLKSIATTLGKDLPVAFKGAQQVLSPFIHDVKDGLGGAWDVASVAAKGAMFVLKPAAQILDDIKGPLGEIGTIALGSWAAFKGVGLVGSLMETFALKSLYAKDAVFGLATSAKASAKGFLGIGAAAATSATEVGLASAAIAGSGELASIGWAEMMGPLVAAGVGVALLVSMFHRSSAASKEATDAAKAYTDALKSGDPGEVTDSISKQLIDNGVPAKITALNKALGSAQFGGPQFVKAIQSSGKPLTDLKSRLQGIIDVNDKITQQQLKGQGRGSQGGVHNPVLDAAQAKSAAAAALLKDLNTQSDALTKTQITEIANYKALGTVAASVDKVASNLNLPSGEVKQYAAMLGLAVTSSGDLLDATQANQLAILGVSKAYDTASSSGRDYLDALQTFSTSAGTATDRASLMEATLKAANGDALGLAGSLAGTTTAIDAMADAFKNQSTQLATQSADQTKAIDAVSKAHRGTETAAARVAAAEAHLAQVQSNPKSTAAAIKSAQASVVSAQNSAANSATALGAAQTAAGKAGVLSYADTERAAIIFSKNVKGVWTAAINTNAKGAGDLIGQLQSMQSAAMTAAGDLYQHDLSLFGDTAAAKKKAADDAYNIYVSKTSAALVAEHTQLGLNVTQAKALATAYFGMPASVKTSIETIGTDPVVTVLNKIGQLLADFTGEKWISVDTKDKATPKLDDLNKKLDALTDRKAGPYLTAQDHLTATLDGILTRMGKINGAQVIAKMGETQDIHGTAGAFASGGFITGKGSGTSDSINARVSNGEYVENALATARNRPILEAMNRGVPFPQAITNNYPTSPHPFKQPTRPITLNMVINNPLPERASESVPAAIRRAANRLDV